MRIGSLCTGYGGLEMALDSVFEDTELVFVADPDKNVSKLLEHHHPEIPNLGDLTVADWNELESIDILTAGYPCQPFSVAGLGKGEEDERAIFKYISTGISVLRPRWVLLENVSGHTVLGGTSVIASLTELGYDCRWILVRASDAGAPHRRTRLFIWGMDRQTGTKPPNTYSKRLQRQRKEYELEKRCEQEETTWGDYGGSIQRWETILGRPAPIPAINWRINPMFVEWMMGLPEGHVTDIDISHNNQVKMLGNGVVPQQAELAIRILIKESYDI